MPTRSGARRPRHWRRPAHALCGPPCEPCATRTRVAARCGGPSPAARKRAALSTRPAPITQSPRATRCLKPIQGACRARSTPVTGLAGDAEAGARPRTHGGRAVREPLTWSCARPAPSGQRGRSVAGASRCALRSPPTLGGPAACLGLLGYEQIPTRILPPGERLYVFTLVAELLST